GHELEQRRRHVRRACCERARAKSTRSIAPGAGRHDRARVPRASSSRKTLDRLLARTGACSRTQARTAIAAGRARVNGVVVRDPDAWVDLVRDRVLFDGAPLQHRPKAVWMLHKPVGT